LVERPNVRDALDFVGEDVGMVTLVGSSKILLPTLVGAN
jgi:hypothetical protein